MYFWLMSTSLLGTLIDQERSDWLQLANVHLAQNAAHIRDMNQYFLMDEIKRREQVPWAIIVSLLRRDLVRILASADCVAVRGA